MDGNDLAVLENEDLPGQALDLDDAPSRGIGHGIEVAADADHAVPGDPARA